MRRNAVIMAAGTASRFTPLSAETPKGLLEVKGEILIERQIRQLREAGIEDIVVVVGYLADKFLYLRDKFGVEIVVNEDFSRYNNTSSLVRVASRLDNTIICCSDHYFTENVFLKESEVSFYSARYCKGATNEYCLTVDSHDNITDVSVGGSDAWYMVGHVFFSSDFSRKFAPMLVKAYEENPKVRNEYWEDLYISNISELPPMKILRWSDSVIAEFDSLDELREFDSSYIEDTRSSVLRHVAERLGCRQSELSGFRKVDVSDDNAAIAPISKVSFDFHYKGETYRYDALSDSLSRL